MHAVKRYQQVNTTAIASDEILIEAYRRLVVFSKRVQDAIAKHDHNEKNRLIDLMVRALVEIDAFFVEHLPESIVPHLLDLSRFIHQQLALAKITAKAEYMDGPIRIFGQMQQTFIQVIDIARRQENDTTGNV